MLTVDRLDEEAWQRLASLRLTALRDAPEAFGSSIEREQRFAEQHWRLRLRGSPWWVAVLDGVDAGLVCAISEPGAPEDERHLVSFWVAPALRRRGMGRALLAAAEKWAADDGARRVTLWLVQGNDAGAAAYRAAGYAPTGTTTPLVRDPSRVEEQWTKDVGA